MELTKEDVCVFIESESHLQQAREVLERYEELIIIHDFFLSSSDYNYLTCMEQGWGLSYFYEWSDTLITLTKLEEILRNKNKQAT